MINEDILIDKEDGSIIKQAPTTVAIKVPMNTDVGDTVNPAAIQDAIKNMKMKEGAPTESAKEAYK